MKRVLLDSIVVGSALFVIGTWLSTHHIHKSVSNSDHPRLRNYILASIVGVALVTVGSNMMTDGFVERLSRIAQPSNKEES